MDSQKQLQIVLSSDSSQAEQDMGKFGDSLNQLTPIGVAVGAMLADLGEKIISFAEQAIVETLKLGENLEYVRTNLDNLTGSTQKTTDILAKLQDLSAKGLFKPEQVDAFTQRLLQMGVSTNDISSLMHDMAAAAVGSSDSLDAAGQKMQTLTTLFGYMEDKGGLTVSMLGRFSKSLGIPVIDAMAKSLGMTTAQFEKLKGSTAVTADMMEKAFATMATGSGEFSKSLSTDSNTLEARQQALGTRFDELKLSILGMSATGEVVKGGFYDKISTATEILITFIDKHKAVLDTLIATIGIGTIAIGLAVIGLAAHTLALGINTVATIAQTTAQFAVTAATTRWTAAQWLLNIAWTQTR